MTMQQKYHDLCGRAGVSTATVSKEAGIPYSTLNEWRKGKTKKISPKNLAKLADYFNVTIDYFYNDEYLDKEQTELLRKIHEVSAGPGRIEGLLDNYDDVGELARVCGDSMYPTLHDGDIVRFIEAVEVSPRDYALVRIDGEALTVKHVEWTETGMWIRGENKDAFEDRFYTAKEIATIPIQIVGKAVEIRRAL